MADENEQAEGYEAGELVANNATDLPDPSIEAAAVRDGEQLASGALIKVKPWGKGQGDFVLVDAEHFDPAVHKLHGEASTPAKAPAPAKRPARKVRK